MTSVILLPILIRQNKKKKKKENKEKISKFFRTTLQYLKKFSEDFVF